MNFRQKNGLEPPSFQITPMIDVVFLLLFFFVTSQIYSKWEEEIDITLPTAETGVVPRRLPGEIIINVKETGQTVINGKQVEADQLQGMLVKLAELFPGQPILLRADGAADFKHVIRVLDLCRKADIWNISFATTTPGS